MLRGRATLPVLAEISGPADGGAAWSLRRAGLRSADPAAAGAGRAAGGGGRGSEETAAVAAIALATAAAAAGRRTILVECDLAQPAAGGRPRPGAGAGPARVPALGGRARRGSCSRSSSPGRRRAAAEPLVCVCRRPARRASPRPCSACRASRHMLAKLRARLRAHAPARAAGSRANRRRPRRSPAQADAVLAAASARGRPGGDGRRCAPLRRPADRPLSAAIAVASADSRSEVVAGEVGVEPLGVLAARPGAGAPGRRDPPDPPRRQRSTADGERRPRRSGRRRSGPGRRRG